MNPRSPDFICIGAQKAGTSWLRANLQKHPQIWMPSVPELHYFDESLVPSMLPPPLAQERTADDTWRHTALTELQRLLAAGDLAGAASWALHRFGDHNDQWYRSLFGLAPAGHLTGDVTPSYMLCGPDEIDRMHAVAPDAKLLFLLRHPVERFWSQCKMKRAEGSLAAGDAAAIEFFETSYGRPRGEYSQAILRFCRRFSPAQMLLVFHEGILLDPAAVMQAVHSFLGLPPVPLDAATLRTPVNQSASKSPMSGDLRGRLEAAYRVEMELLADVFGGYPATWLGLPAGDAPAAVVQLTADHVDAFKQHHRQRQRRHKERIFCVSMQRSGTTSVGDWLEAHGLSRAGSPTARQHGWTRLWLEGNVDAIFASEAFANAEVFEDDPWWCPDFYRVVAERYPEAKFILLERDPDDWFDSMCHHSGGKNPGWSDIHARIYGREPELQQLLADQPNLQADAWGLLSIVEHRDHYTRLYRQHGDAVRAFFQATPQRLFQGRLDDPTVFSRLRDFVGLAANPAIAVPRSNVRTPAMRQHLQQTLNDQPAATALPSDQPTATGRSAEPLTVFIVSWGRPLYLWACLDTLCRQTHLPARFVLLDNAHPDPLVDEVIAGFERRGMFAEVVRFETNSLANITAAYQERLDQLGPWHAYIESDCVVVPRTGCWLTEMQGIMQRHPQLGMLGSLIDPTDFVPPATAVRLAAGDPTQAEFLAKLQSPERGFLREPTWADSEAEFFLTEPPFPILNPPGRLMLLRTDLMRAVGFQLDASLAGMVRDRGLLAAVTPRVLHRHLSLLNIYDYPDYDQRTRDEFFLPPTTVLK